MIDTTWMVYAYYDALGGEVTTGPIYYLLGKNNTI